METKKGVKEKEGKKKKKISGGKKFLVWEKKKKKCEKGSLPCKRSQSHLFLSRNFFLYNPKFRFHVVECVSELSL